MRYQFWGHANCYDGFGALWAARSAMQAARLAHGWAPETIYREVSYNEPPPEVMDGDTVFILDFSYPLAVLVDLSRRCRQVIVIDHHKTAEEDLRSLPTVYGANEVLINRPSTPQVRLSAFFDMGRSGAGLAWDLLCSTPRPKLISYLEDRDLWRFNLPHSKAISAAIGACKKTFDSWDALAAELDHSFKTVVAAGEAILAYKDEQVEMICSQAITTTIKGVQCRVVNSTSLWSEVGASLAAEAQFSASYFRVKSGDWRWSLRSAAGFDVSELARQFGGGGHKAAAGFHTKTLEEVLGT